MSERPAVIVAREVCMGFGYCTEIAPEVFTLDEDGRSVPGTATVDLARLQDAVDGCPRSAISLRWDSRKEE